MTQELLFKILRQLLSNQFTILKILQNKEKTTPDQIENRLHHTDKLLNEMYLKTDGQKT